MEIGKTDEESSSGHDVALCKECIMGKQHRLLFHPATKKEDELGGRVFCDLCGQIEPKSFGNDVYFAINGVSSRRNIAK